MVELIQMLPPIAGAIVFIGATIVLSISAYAGTRWLLLTPGTPPERDLANSVVVRVSALHALILALVFAQELVNLRAINSAATREAALVGDVFYDLARYDAEETLGIREELSRYTYLVFTEEWPSMAEHKTLHSGAWKAWDAAYQEILTLSPSDARQSALKDIMLTDIRAISGLRHAREDAGLTNVHGLFMVAAGLGVVLTAVGFFVHPPTRQNLFLISVFASYTGLIIYFVVAFANPYAPPGMASPIGFQQIFEGEIRMLHERSVEKNG